MRRLLPLLALSLAVACAPRGPQVAAQAYTRALSEGRLDDAWEALDPASRAEVGREGWEAALADPGRRAAEVEAVQAAADPGAVLGAPGTSPRLVRRDRTWQVLAPPRPVAPEGAAREALVGFLAAVDAGDFAAVWARLGPAQRARTTPERLARELAEEGDAARAVLERLRAALAARVPLEIRGDQAYVPLGPGQAVRLEREDDTWRITSLH